MKIPEICYTQKRLNFVLIILITLCVSSEMLHAQMNDFSADYYFKQSLSLQKKGMLVLGSWALINIATGTLGTFKLQDERKYFHQMNAAWNIVNLGIAAFGYYGASNSDMNISTANMMMEVSKLNKILLINAGLDLLYISAGVWLWKNGLNNTSNRKSGYGKSLVIQGGFLLIFDTVLYLLNRQYSEGMLSLNDKIALLPNGFRISF